MTIRHWSTVPYSCRLPKPIVTAHGAYVERTGLLLAIHDSGGVVGLGDVAPLPGFSHETTESVGAQWAAIQNEIQQLNVPASIRDFDGLTSNLDRLTTGFPSLRYGLELALADLAARRADVSVARWLSANCVENVDVNALLTSDDPAILAEQASSAFAKGFRTFKMKVAVRPVVQDVERVAAVRRAVPQANLRIDANEGWAESQVSEIFPHLKNLNLEFVEQPLPVGRAVVARRYSKMFGIPLALDEEAGSITDAQRLLRDDLCDGIVLKPMISGGLLGNLALAAEAHRTNVKVIFTSAWESDVGVAGTLHLACAAGSAAAPVGLSTAGMIAEGLVEPALKIDGGKLSVHGLTGLGLRLMRKET